MPVVKKTQVDTMNRPFHNIVYAHVHREIELLMKSIQKITSKRNDKLISQHVVHSFLKHLIPVFATQLSFESIDDLPLQVNLLLSSGFGLVVPIYDINYVKWVHHTYVWIRHMEYKYGLPLDRLFPLIAGYLVNKKGVQSFDDWLAHRRAKL